MRRHAPTIAVAVLSAGLLVHAADLATSTANAGPLRGAARIAKRTGKALAHVLPGHARRVERRQARMIGEYYGKMWETTTPIATPIGQIIGPTQTALMDINPRCPGGICPYGTLPPPTLP